jgi:hypothetical protein
MPDDALESEFFQSLFGVVRDILSPATAIFSDPAARSELFGTLGLDASADVGSLPSTTRLDEYIAAQADETDAILLAAAFADLVQVTLAIEGAVRAGIDADEDNPGLAVDEIINAFLNVLLMDYVRRQNPPVYAAARLVSTLNAKTAEIGGSFGIAEVIGDFFKRLFSGLDTPADAEAMSQTIFVLLGAAFYLIDRCALKPKGIDNVHFKLGFGYEGITDSPTPIADAIADRTMSYSVTALPFDDPDNQGTFYNTITFVPSDHGGVAVVTDLSGEIDTTLPVTDDISFKIDLAGEGIFRIDNPPTASAGTNNRVAITFKHKRDDAGLVKIFPTPEIKTGLKTYSLTVTLKPDDFDIKFSSKLPFELKRDEDAGFPMSLLPAEIKEEIPLDFGYSVLRDFYFGSGGGNPGNTAADGATPAADAVAAEEEPSFIEQILAKLLNLIDIRAPIHKDIGGVLGIQVLNVKVEVTESFDTMSLESSIDFWLKLGSVLTISVSRLGARLELEERDDNGGLLGYDLTPKFKPPTGAGVVVDAAVVKGGGFLYFDDTNGEYFGALELEFQEIVALKAVGIINTIMPDGSKGFSLLILVTAEFSPISLAFGFTLDGVGGLLGLNRTVEVEALRIGVRTNAIKSILFPQDVVGNISRIISDIKDFFPVKEDQFVIGLMAQLGYGGSDLVKIELGVIVEIPDPKILILGVIKVVAPDEDRDALKLQVNFLGVIDIPNEFIYFEAHLFDSHVVGFPLTGSLAFVVGWGDNGMFAISVGGFHPDFNDYPTVPTLPGAFRDMSRIGFSLLGGDNPRLTVECYFAVTSNSLQFGAKLELLASGPMGFNLYGMLSFDALFIFDPFSFTISLQATLAIRKGTSILFGISFKGLLSGPNPWHVEGEVTFGLLFFDVTIGFSETWGDSLEDVAAATIDLVGTVRSELRDTRNWRVEMGNNLHQSVTHRALEAPSDDEIVIFPFGELSFSQRTLPLNVTIEKYGELRPSDETRVDIGKVRVADAPQSTESVKELFAPGHYTKLSEKEKLSRKSFEKFDSGFAMRDSGKLLTATPDLGPLDLDYELNYTADDAPDRLIFGIDLKAFAQMSRKAAVSKSDLSWAKSRQGVLNKVEPVTLPTQDYAIAKTSDLREFDPALRSSTLAEAKSQLDALVANDPDLEDEIQVVFMHELAG